MRDIESTEFMAMFVLLTFFEFPGYSVPTSSQPTFPSITGHADQIKPRLKKSQSSMGSICVLYFMLGATIKYAVTDTVAHYGGVQEQDKISTIVRVGEANKTYEGHVNSYVQYIYQFLFNASSYGRDGDIRVHSRCNATESPELPVMFVVRQQRNVLSWQLPQRSRSGKTYFMSSRTLCSEVSEEEDDDVQTIIVTISTATARNVSFSIKVSVEKSFVMTLDREYNTTISPPSPRFYRFIFSESENTTFPVSISSQFVLLEVFSDDLTCMTVSVQNSTCPVFDEESNVQFEGYWQTMSTRGGMTLNRAYFPNGFYVVFVMHSDDSRCTTHEKRISRVSTERMKQVRFNITPKITYMEYVSAIFGLLAFFLLFYLLAVVISICHCYRTPIIQFEADETSSGNSAATNGTGNAPIMPVSSPGEVIAGPSGGQQPITNRRRPRDERITESESAHWLDSEDSSLDETEIDTLEDARRDKDIYRASTSLFVSALARKNPRVLAKKSQLYLWTLITVAIFYAIPVLQLVFTYQHVLHTTGNLDLCYYNYLCSHPLWILSDFNHVYSNIGYIMLGILFLFLVYRKDRMHQRRLNQTEDIEKFGIPRHFGLFYAMGLALIMEGFLSGCYHICPNGSNFQFDTAFMYIIALICILKIYQTRHPDINASAYATFAAMAFVILIGVLGVLVGSMYFWIAFTALHVLVCLFLSFQIYYLGRWRLDGGLVRRVYGRWKNDCLASPLSCLRPLYIDRLILLIFANAANWTIAGYGVTHRPPDFASHLLLIFMSNLFIYTLFYIVMKVTHREKILLQPLIYIFLTFVFWSLALWIFLQKSTSWQLSPSESRTFNRECLILRFYDTHDIWHVVSSIGLFVWYMVLLTLDDDLMDVPRDRIAVF